MELTTQEQRPQLPSDSSESDCSCEWREEHADGAVSIWVWHCNGKKAKWCAKDFEWGATNAPKHLRNWRNATVEVESWDTTKRFIENDEDEKTYSALDGFDKTTIEVEEESLCRWRKQLVLVSQKRHEHQRKKQQCGLCLEERRRLEKNIREQLKFWQDTRKSSLCKRQVHES